MGPFAHRLSHNKEISYLHSFLFCLLLFHPQLYGQKKVVYVAIFKLLDYKVQLENPLNLHKIVDINEDKASMLSSLKSLRLCQTIIKVWQLSKMLPLENFIRYLGYIFLVLYF